MPEEVDRTDLLDSLVEVASTALANLAATTARLEACTESFLKGSVETRQTLRPALLALLDETRVVNQGAAMAVGSALVNYLSRLEADVMA